MIFKARRRVRFLLLENEGLRRDVAGLQEENVRMRADMVRALDSARRWKADALDLDEELRLRKMCGLS